MCSSHQVVAFSFESSGLRLTQSIRSNSHAGTRIHVEFLTPDPVLSLLTEQSLVYFTIHAMNLSENGQFRSLISELAWLGHVYFGLDRR
ncbi:MAG: hypothetical protein JNM39_04475 [Bdellovibrionaceae bacterium]|nr:hypothetical protein [Pseudobdellovibrionaceae bacterium]